MLGRMAISFARAIPSRLGTCLCANLNHGGRRIEPVIGRIFINYRRGDAQGAAGRLYDRLLQHFERSQLFMDVDAIEPGVDFVKSLDEQVSNCSAFIAVIGPGWASAQDSEGSRRLDNPADYVRIELESALKRDIRVIPVLVDGAAMPRASDLPDSLQPLLRRNAVEFAHHRFVADCDDLARGIKRALGIAAEEPPPLAQPIVVPPPPAQEAPAQRMSWAEVMFSFNGRIARLRYFVGAMIILASAIAIYGAISVSSSDIFAGDEQKWNLFEKRIGWIATVTLWWPTWALLLKRLHDLGLGLTALLPFIALDLGMQVLDYFDYDQLSWQFNMFYFGAILMLAIAKGTNGPNKYGPDPLAGRRPAAKANA
jgi:uncharacterized membrane protein YhaH (DUF805 family)